MAAMCTLTALLDSISLRAIAPVDNPWASRERTSHSRLVSRPPNAVVGHWLAPAGLASAEALKHAAHQRTRNGRLT